MRRKRQTPREPAARIATSRWALGLALGALLGCADPGPAATESDPDCVPHFPYRQGWLGADAAYSVSLPPAEAGSEERTLWLFGDTFVHEDPASTDRQGSVFIHNSVGISQCAERGFEIEYAWGRKADGAPAAFLQSDRPGRYWWLFDGFVHRGSLYLGLLEVSDEPAPETPLGLGFRLEGMRLARIPDPQLPPAQWRAEIATLSTTRLAFPAAALLVHEDHLYFFSFMAMRNGQQPRFLARLALESVEEFPADLSSQFETRTPGGGWAAGFLPEKADRLMDDNASEMSVEFHPDLGRWLALYASPLQVGEPEKPAGASVSSTVYIRLAERLAGPWSERVPVYDFPELLDPRRLPGTFCYAAKSHRDLAASEELLVTYVCNLSARSEETSWQSLQRLATSMNLYRPRVARIPLPRLDAKGCPVANAENAAAPSGDSLVLWRRATGCAAEGGDDL